MKVIKLLTLVFCSIALLFLGSCAPIEQDPEPVEVAFFGHATDKVKHKHKKSVDPCPQEIKAPVLARCYTGTDINSCEIDSVNIDYKNAGYTCSFKDGASGVRFDGTVKEHAIEMKFTCSIAKSFKDTVDLRFYNKNKEVSTEMLEVDVTVE